MPTLVAVLSVLTLAPPNSLVLAVTVVAAVVSVVVEVVAVVADAVASVIAAAVEVLVEAAAVLELPLPARRLLSRSEYRDRWLTSFFCYESQSV